MPGSAAFAAMPVGDQPTFGTIKAISGGSFTLTKGDSFPAPYGFGPSNLHVGEKVNLVCLPDGTSGSQPDDVARVVSSITAE